MSGLTMSAKVYERIAKGVMREEGSCGLFGVSSDHNFCTLCKGFMVRVANCRTKLAGAPAAALPADAVGHRRAQPLEASPGEA